LQNSSITIGDTTVPPGRGTIVHLPVTDLYTHTQLTLPVHVVNGRKPGPTLFLTAAIHGDELNGVDIIRRLLKIPEIKRLNGCLLALPIVNVFGFINRSRYLPDRRDLNRSFPGSEKGSVAARLANLVSREIISKADYGIDLHTAAIDRTNLPQIRADLDNPRVLAMAKAFATPVIINANIVEGSLRGYTAQKDIPIIVYEAGEALRFDEVAVRAGVRGVRRVMRELEMLPPRQHRRTAMEPVISTSTTWVRAPGSGIVHHRRRLGARVQTGETLATIGDPFGEVQFDVASTASGIVIGHSMLPLAHEGDALFHIAQFDNTLQAKATIEEFQQTYGTDLERP
jgi:uncharacterized protein